LQRLFGILRVKLQQIDGEPGAEIELNNNIPNAKQASLLLSELSSYRSTSPTVTP
jgi:hypothetical protein